jgi:hypothetical protein
MVGRSGAMTSLLQLSVGVVKGGRRPAISCPTEMCPLDGVAADLRRRRDSEFRYRDRAKPRPMPAGPRSCAVVSKIPGAPAQPAGRHRGTFRIPWGYECVPEPHGAVGRFRSPPARRKCVLISAGCALAARRYCWSEKASDRQAPRGSLSGRCCSPGVTAIHGGDCPTPGCWQNGDKRVHLPGSTRVSITPPLWITDDGTLGASCSRNRGHGQTGAPGPVAASY